MEPTPPAEDQPVASALQEASEIVDQVSNYSALITDSLYVIIGGMIAVFLLYKLTSKFLFPYVKNRRLLRVVFGTIYVLILVVTMLVVLNKIGIETTAIGKVAIIAVLISAVAIFFLIPFLPRLPFMIGQMIEVNGVFGIVDNISTLHTTIRTFDGGMVFLPNPLVLASKITNFSDIPFRRIALNLTVNLDADIENVRALILRIINADERVLVEPASPVVRATTASASGINLTALCWTKNEDFLNTQSDLWIQVVNAFKNDNRVTMALPQQEIHIVNEKGA
jgi:small conductance mechanosensitive channel